MLKKINKIWNYLPLLRLDVEIPFLSIRTNLMYRSYDMDIIQYISLQIHLFKWFFEFRLYDTFQRIEDRKR